MRTIDRSQPDYAQKLEALSRRSASVPEEIEASARRIIAEVRAGGDSAVRALTARFDNRQLGELDLPRERWHDLAAQTAPAVRAALEHAARRIRAFHERERYLSFEIVEGGTRIGSRVSPLARVGS